MKTFFAPVRRLARKIISEMTYTVLSRMSKAKGAMSE